MTSTGKHTPGPHPINEAGYWRSPVQVFSGMTWLIIGLLVGGLVL